MGPIQTGKPRFGECVYCWAENHTRKNGAYFEARQRMIGPICKHHLLPPARATKQFKINRFHGECLEKRGGRPLDDRMSDEFYWYIRAMWPDFCGEPGELSIHCAAAIQDRIYRGTHHSEAEGN
jgi:hypothetical protein